MQQLIKSSTARWHSLADKFQEASTEWPGVESFLTLWREGNPPPKYLEANPGVGVPAPEGELHYVATLIGGGTEDTPAHRYFRGSCGRLTLRMACKHFGGPRYEVTDPERIAACGDRFKALCGFALQLVRESAPGVCEKYNPWNRWTAWQLILHGLDSLTEHTPDGRYIPDVFLASSDALYVLVDDFRGAMRRAFKHISGKTLRLDGRGTSSVVLPKPLNPDQQKAFDYIRDNGPQQGSEITNQVQAEEPTVYRWLSKSGALYAHGVRNLRNTEGYVVEKP